MLGLGCAAFQQLFNPNGALEGRKAFRKLVRQTARHWIEVVSTEDDPMFSIPTSVIQRHSKTYLIALETTHWQAYDKRAFEAGT